MASGTINSVCRETIKQTLTVFHGPDSTIELRALGVDGRRNRTDSGYFEDIDLATDAIVQHAGSWKSKGIYFGLNPILPALLSRAENRIRVQAETTTSDNDVIGRRWLYLDFDPVRPSEISSTEKEHAKALLRSNDVSDWLKEQGFPEPVLADSGNGAHLHYPIDLPQGVKSTALVKAVTAEISQRFSDDTVKIDVSVFNPSRICRLYGTWARKGDDTKDRPHRRSELLHVPHCLGNGWKQSVAATADLLEKIKSLSSTATSSAPADGIPIPYHGAVNSFCTIYPCRQIPTKSLETIRRRRQREIEQSGTSDRQAGRNKLVCVSRPLLLALTVP